MEYTKRDSNGGKPVKLVTETNTLIHDKNEWETPDVLFTQLNDKYHFDVDAAANQYNHKLPKWFGPGAPFGLEDALSINWRSYGEYFWCNPPYGRGLLEPFLKKAYEEYNKGAKIVMLLPVDTSTDWWHSWVDTWVHAYKVEFIKGRIKFKGATGSPRFASCLLKLV
jgi:site-specific DNA-methyltransferase (adenine-specific)